MAIPVEESAIGLDPEHMLHESSDPFSFSGLSSSHRRVRHDRESERIASGIQRGVSSPTLARSWAAIVEGSDRERESREEGESDVTGARKRRNTGSQLDNKEFVMFSDELEWWPSQVSDEC